MTTCPLQLCVAQNEQLVRALQRVNAVLLNIIDMMRSSVGSTMDEKGASATADNTETNAQVEVDKTVDETVDEVSIPVPNAREDAQPAVAQPSAVIDVQLAVGAFTADDYIGRVGKTSNCENSCFAAVVAHGLLRHSDELLHHVRYQL